VQQAQTWSSTLAFYLVTAGAAVGLGSIWRFPYLAGQYGGSTFLLPFIACCLLIAVPILAAEYLIGRRGRASPPEAALRVARQSGLSTLWASTGWLGTVTVFLIMSYYSIIGGWVLAYTAGFAGGAYTGLEQPELAERFRSLLASPWQLLFWNTLFLAASVAISAAGIQRGIELGNRIMLPGLFVLLLLLVGYSLSVGDVERGLGFVFGIQPELFGPDLLLAAVGQAFFATGVGMAIMMAYGAYLPQGVALVRSAGVVALAIVAASVLASLLIFPLAFRYEIDPAQGSELAFIVLPTIFVDMPGGRLVGVAFFILLAFAAFSSMIGGIEPMLAWLRERLGWSRTRAAISVGLALWVVGLLSVLSFNVWAGVRPLAGIANFADLGIFELIDYVTANLMLPIGALITCVLVAWRLPKTALAHEVQLTGGSLTLFRLLLGVLCPAAILAVFAANL
jgi:neurotransmitter:Na+ symporter, NSS family